MLKINKLTNWRDGINKIMIGDCLELMRKMEDNSVDLVLTDPPYGIKWHGTGFKNQKHFYETYKKELDNWDKKPSKEIWSEIKRVSKNQMIFGINYFTEYFGNFTPIVWDKKNGKSIMADGELIGTSIKTKMRIFRHAYIGRYHPEPIRLHPTQKPLILIQWLLENYTKENDIVFDPFMGSWTTAVACQSLHRRFIGAEISKEYCEIGRQRLRQQVLI